MTTFNAHTFAGAKRMTSVDTTRFGPLEIADGDIITFTQPILGFPERRRFVPVPGPPDSFLTWLQSTEDGSLAFLMMDPRAVVPGYRVNISAHDLTELAAQSSDELAIYTLVASGSEPDAIRTNLRAPIVINPRQRLAKQSVLESSAYPIRHHLPSSAVTRQEEATHVGSDA